jgi:hypothetical protein
MSTVRRAPNTGCVLPIGKLVELLMKSVCVIQRYWPTLSQPTDRTSDPVADLRDMVADLGFNAAPLNIVELP